MSNFFDDDYGYEYDVEDNDDLRYDSYGERDTEDDEYPIDGVGFADPGGRSALRAATCDNPRYLPCPTCHRPNMLTRIEKARGYQCDRCADALENGGGY